MCVVEKNKKNKVKLRGFYDDNPIPQHVVV